MWIVFSVYNMFTCLRESEQLNQKISSHISNLDQKEKKRKNPFYKITLKQISCEEQVAGLITARSHC